MKSIALSTCDKMKILIPYPESFTKVMKLFQLQVLSGVPYAKNDRPEGFRDLQDLWRFYRPKIKYVNDPDGNELFQAYQTLLGPGNIHGIPGAGDCDCFSLMTATVCEAHGIDYKIRVVGRSKAAPVHIYTLVSGVVVDFTQPEIGRARHYPYKQDFDLCPARPKFVSLTL